MIVQSKRHFSFLDSFTPGRFFSGGQTYPAANLSRYFGGGWGEKRKKVLYYTTIFSRLMITEVEGNRIDFGALGISLLERKK